MPDAAPPSDQGDGAPALTLEDLDALYDFALTVTWEPDTAFEAVVTGLEAPYGPGEVPQLFARVREVAIRVAPPPPGPVVDLGAELPPPDHPAGGSLEALALGVASGLEPSERAALDLGLRHRFEGDDLATVLGTTVDGGVAAVEDARNRADRLLGHYVLARVATEACPRLREVLDEPPDELEPLAAIVDQHLAECSMCTDRRHTIHPPSALLADLPARPAPETLRNTILPPSDDGQPWFRRVRDRRHARNAAVVAGVVVAGSLLGVQLFGDSGTSTSSKGPGARLRVEPASVDLAADESVTSATLRNDTGRAVDYRVEVDVEYLAVEPAEGRIDPGGSAGLTITLDRSAAPEGHSVTTVRVVGRTGTAQVEVAADVSRGPAIADLGSDPSPISAAPCEEGVTRATLSAAVADDSGIGSVVARWEGPALFDADSETLGESEGEIELTRSDGTFSGRLGPFGEAGTVTWSVEATDAGGTTTTSDEATFEVIAECVPADEASG